MGFGCIAIGFVADFIGDRDPTVVAFVGAAITFSSFPFRIIAVGDAVPVAAAAACVRRPVGTLADGDKQPISGTLAGEV